MRLVFHIFFIASLEIAACGQKAGKSSQPIGDSLALLIPDKSTNWVTDRENLLTKEQTFYLDSIIAEHEVQTSNEIAVLIYSPDSSFIKTKEKFEELSLELFNSWGIGKKDKNNGILLFVAPSLRKVRIETGYGLVTKLTNEEAKQIIDTILVPAFKEVEFFKGISAGLQAIIKEIK